MDDDLQVSTVPASSAPFTDAALPLVPLPAVAVLAGMLGHSLRRNFSEGVGHHAWDGSAETLLVVVSHPASVLALRTRRQPVDRLAMPPPPPPFEPDLSLITEPRRQPVDPFSLLLVIVVVLLVLLIVRGF